MIKLADANNIGDVQPKAVIVGCGGAGCSTVNRLHRAGFNDADTIAVDTDKHHLDAIRADKRILIGKSLTRGLGAGGFPDIGKKAAELSRGTLEDVLKDADLVFVAAGMGGGTGTGSVSVIAEIAKEQGAIVVGMVSTPFHVEKVRMIKAREGLKELRDAAHIIITLDNNMLYERAPTLQAEQAFTAQV